MRKTEREIRDLGRTAKEVGGREEESAKRCFEGWVEDVKRVRSYCYSQRRTSAKINRLYVASRTVYEPSRSLSSSTNTRNRSTRQAAQTTLFEHFQSMSPPFSLVSFSDPSRLTARTPPIHHTTPTFLRTRLRKALDLDRDGQAFNRVIEEKKRFHKMVHLARITMVLPF